MLRLDLLRLSADDVDTSRPHTGSRRGSPRQRRDRRAASRQRRSARGCCGPITSSNRSLRRRDRLPHDRARSAAAPYVAIMPDSSRDRVARSAVDHRGGVRRPGAARLAPDVHAGASRRPAVGVVGQHRVLGRRVAVPRRAHADHLAARAAVSAPPRDARADARDPSGGRAAALRRVGERRRGGSCGARHVVGRRVEASGVGELDAHHDSVVGVHVLRGARLRVRVHVFRRSARARGAGGAARGAAVRRAARRASRCSSTRTFSSTA